MSTTRSWAAGYLHRALQLARDESAHDEQVRATVGSLQWFLPTPNDLRDCESGASVAGSDVRTLANGQREWVLIGAPNYRTAGQLLTMHTSKSEQAELMREFLRVVAARQGTLTGAAALVSRIEQRWRTGSALPSLPDNHGTPPAVFVLPTRREPVFPSSRPVNPLVGMMLADELSPSLRISIPASREVRVSEEYAFTTAPDDLPLPDPAWFESVRNFVPGKVVAGAKEVEGTREAEAKATWALIAQWLQLMTHRALGAEWTATPHQWQNSGNFSSYYWGKVYPAAAPLGNFFNVGIQIAREAKWVDEFDEGLRHFKGAPILALWVTTNDDKIKRLRDEDPAFVDAAVSTYRRVQMEAFAESPELWVEGGALVRWYSGPRNARVSTLTTARAFRDAVASGRQSIEGSSADMWSPLLPLAEASADPRRAASLVFSYLRVFGKILADTYAQIGPGPGGIR